MNDPEKTLYAVMDILVNVEEQKRVVERQLHLLRQLVETLVGEPAADPAVATVTVEEKS